jgi:D-alanyl-D-alanine carboxypeptidase/D-alanyl-D-alanine-endopeptidase (penicillin-binding protein 4)
VPDVALPGVMLTSRLVLQDAAACGDWKDAITPSLSTAGAPALALDGPYPRACGEQSLSLNLFDAATTFDLIFRGLWAQAGGTL